MLASGRAACIFSSDVFSVIVVPDCKKHIQKILPSLKLTASLHLKMDGWNVSFLLGPGLFSGANSLLVSGSVFETDVWNFLFNKHQIVAD